MKINRRSDGLYEIEHTILDGTDLTFNKRGYCGIGIHVPHNAVNVGMMLRNSQAYNADFAFIIGEGSNYKSKANTGKAHKHLPLFRFKNYDDFREHIPANADVVAIDNMRDVRIPRPLETFVHPERAIYILGSERGGLPNNIIRGANSYVFAMTAICLNVAVTSAIVLYDRFQKGLRNV